MARNKKKPELTAAEKKAAAAAALQKLVNTKVGMTNLFKGGVLVVVHDSGMARQAELLGARGVIIGNQARANAIDTEETVSAANPSTVKDVLNTVMVPVVGRIRVGHMTESLLMETCGVDVIDEHESMTSSGGNPVDKYGKTPHIAAVKNLETALDAICKGASMLRTECPKDENKPKTLKDTSEMIKTIFKDIKVYSDMTPEALKTKLDTLTPSKASLIRQCVRHKRLPVPLFADGGVVLPLDAALMMHFGADGVVASAQVFKAKNPENRIRAMVMAVTHFNDPYKLSRYSEGNGIAGPELKYE